jgi:hypothetical protein
MQSIEDTIEHRSVTEYYLWRAAGRILADSRISVVPGAGARAIPLRLSHAKIRWVACGAGTHSCRLCCNVPYGDYAAGSLGWQLLAGQRRPVRGCLQLTRSCRSRTAAFGKAVKLSTAEMLASPRHSTAVDADPSALTTASIANSVNARAGCAALFRWQPADARRSSKCSHTTRRSVKERTLDDCAF